MCALTVKLRVMPRCWLVLLRLWVRVDGSMVRLRETRLFCRWGVVHAVSCRCGPFHGCCFEGGPGWAERRSSAHNLPLTGCLVRYERVHVSTSAPLGHLRRHDKPDKRLEVLQVMRQSPRSVYVRVT